MESKCGCDPHGRKEPSGINRIIMEFKCECDPHGRKEPSGINRIIMEFKYWNQAVL